MNAPTPPTDLPISIEVEQALLGAILVEPAAYDRVSGFLTSEHFSEEIHRRIFETFGRLFQEGKAATPMLLKTYLGDHELAPGMTTGGYLARLAAEAATVVNADSYGQAIYDLSIRRALISRAEDLIDAAKKGDRILSALTLLEEHESELSSLRNGLTTASSPIISAETALDRVVSRMVARSKGEITPAVTTGFYQLDDKIGGGFREGRLIVIAGRPGMGKTIFAIASARRTAKKGNGVGIFSLEIDAEEIGARLIASHYGKDVAPIHYSSILSGKLNADDEERVALAEGDLRDYPIEIDCTAGLTIAAIESRARTMDTRLRRKGFSLQVLYIDYLQLVAASDRYRGRRVDEVGEIALAAKNISKRLGCAVVLFSQLNRGVEAREDKRPTMADVRDSGNIEEHADAIALLYRPAYYDQKTLRLLDRGVNVKVEPGFEEIARQRRYDLEIILDKNRLGPQDTVTLACDPARSMVDSGREIR